MIDIIELRKLDNEVKRLNNEVKKQRRQLTKELINLFIEKEKRYKQSTGKAFIPLLASLSNIPDSYWYKLKTQDMMTIDKLELFYKVLIKL